MDYLQFYTTLKGRTGRREFALKLMLPLLALCVLAGFIDVALGFEGTGPVSILVLLIVLWPSLALTTRRLHDVNISGWWQLVFIIPLIGLIAFIVAMCWPGTKSDNKYGHDPLEGVK